MPSGFSRVKSYEVIAKTTGIIEEILVFSEGNDNQKTETLIILIESKDLKIVYWIMLESLLQWLDYQNNSGINYRMQKQL